MNKEIKIILEAIDETAEEITVAAQELIDKDEEFDAEVKMVAQEIGLSTVKIIKTFAKTLVEKLEKKRL